MLLRWMLLCLMPLAASASHQWAETILIDGKPTPLLETPLEDYWSAEHPKPPPWHYLSTGCYRGYLGTWEIKDRRLMLLRIVRSLDEQPEPSAFVSLKEALGVPSEGPVFAEWFSGVLPVAHGIERGRLGFEYESPQVDYLYIVRGRVTRRITVRHPDPESPVTTLAILCRFQDRHSPAERTDPPDHAAAMILPVQSNPRETRMLPRVAFE